MPISKQVFKCPACGEEFRVRHEGEMFGGGNASGSDKLQAECPCCQNLCEVTHD